MGEFAVNCSLPLDDDKFLRRECPFCCRELKVYVEESELIDLAQKAVNSFMLESNEEISDTEEISSSEIESFCPYCGQKAPQNSWWTQEQLAYLKIFAKNIMAKIVNERLIRPLKRRSGSSTSSFQFKGHEMSQQEPWISPEINDMEIFELPCCQQKVKILEDWTGEVCCFVCGFPHKIKEV